MKIESEENSVMQDAYNGMSAQVHNKIVSKVLMQDGWHDVVLGSFKLHKTQANVPFVRFDMTMDIDNEEALVVENKVHTVELFPQSLHGVAYVSDSPLPVNGENDLTKVEEFVSEVPETDSGPSVPSAEEFGTPTLIQGPPPEAAGNDA